MAFRLFLLSNVPLRLFASPRLSVSIVATVSAVDKLKRELASPCNKQSVALPEL